MANRGLWLLGSPTGRSKQQRFLSLDLHTAKHSLEEADPRLTSCVQVIAEVLEHPVLEIQEPR